MSMRRAASWCQPLQEISAPRGARTVGALLTSVTGYLLLFEGGKISRTTSLQPRRGGFEGGSYSPALGDRVVHPERPDGGDQLRPDDGGQEADRARGLAGGQGGEA